MVSEKFNEAIVEYLKTDSSKQLHPRSGKQCRERWITALDPSINKQQWTLKEDCKFLNEWLNFGNKWKEITKLMVGRTESQVKNRFKLLLRKEGI
mmetsp:Transcript_37682/g.57716  ORF Transcript_37682/g.57716 Transcript_37682/m.57716 type:complete len:95 (+) Transcript_37682:2997-3281(+)